jgi:hypothetical protein
MALPDLTLAEQFSFFADSAERDGASTYAAICRGVATDDALLTLTAQAPESQRRPNILLAAVHFLLLGGVDHPLGNHYDTVCAWRDQPYAAPTDDVTAAFHSFCLEHAEPVLELVSYRNTQTNEVGRCTALLPALAHLSTTHHEGRALSLLDVGTSAGLNLFFDHYGYHYRTRDGDDSVDLGPLDSPVQLDCVIRSDLAALPRTNSPLVAQRAGLDLHPINPRSDDESLWLLACQWPDHLPRFNRVKGALSVARAIPDPPFLYEGDLVDDLARVVDQMPVDGPLVVFHSWVAAYLTEQRQAELVEAVRALGHRRPVHHLYAESPVETPGLPTPDPPERRASSDLVTALVHIPSDGPPERLADMHHHGRWLNWWPR